MRMSDNLLAKIARTKNRTEFDQLDDRPKGGKAAGNQSLKSSFRKKNNICYSSKLTLLE